MWISPITEHTSTQNLGGKGGPTQTNTTYTYTQSVAVGLCEGPIAGMSRVWENGTLVYDIRPQFDGESDTDYANRLTVAAAYAETFTLHLGDEEQVADATIESVEGMGNVPGFRGLVYIVYPDRKLLETQALRHPAFRFECYETGAGNCVTTAEISNEVLYPWKQVGPTDDPRDMRNSYAYYLKFWDNHVPNPPSGGGTGDVAHTTLTEALGVAAGFYGFGVDVYLSYGVSVLDSNDGVADIAASGGNTIIGHPEARTIQMHFNTSQPTFVDPSTSDGPFFFNVYSSASPPPAPFYTIGSKWWQGGLNLATSTLVGDGTPALVDPWLNTQNGSAGYVWFQTIDAVVYAVRSPAAPPDQCDGLPAAPIDGYAIRTDGKYVRCGPWTYDPSNNYKVLQQFTGGANSAVLPLNPTILEGSADDTEAFWTAAYNQAVIDGTMVSGLSFGSGYPFRQPWAYTLDLQVCDGAGGVVSLGHIIRAICARSGLTDVDASDMDAVTVDGYAIANVSAGRDILTPLRSVGFFDCVESGPTLKFVARGKAVVASLGLDDFGAFDGGATGGIPGPSITTMKAQDADLPLQTRVHYFATSRDYEDGEQLSPTRLTTTAVNVVDIELAVCMGDQQAAKIADVLWATPWAERWSGALAVDQAWSELEPGDCIEVPVDGETRRIRIVSESVASGVLRSLQYVRDDDGAYVSHAVSSTPIRQPQKLKLLSATDLELLDLPALVDSDNDAGIYAAACGSTLSGNSWNGCIIFRSADGGATFAQLGSITTAAAIGTLQAAVTASDWHAWDDATTIVVNVPASVTFESRTDAAVLTGANAAAMGANGRWEIVQFANATQLSPTQWRLSRLLRGRRGTEHNIASSQTGDKFIMISTGALVRLPLQVAEIGAARIYKAVSIGASYASGINQTFAGQGVALRPFSPVHLTAERDTAGDIVLHWTRRGRLGRTWMSGVDIPLSEATESYSVDIYSPDSPHTIVRTLATSTPTAIYTAAHQSTDFGSDSATHLMVAVYQISATVGRGTPDIQNLTIS